MTTQFDFVPVAIVTDVHYRMSLALIRDLGEAGIRVITCERESHRNNPRSPALGSLSGFCFRHVWLPDEGYSEALLALCRQVREESGKKPALLPVGAGTLGMLSTHRSAFDEVCGLLIPSQEQLDLMNDKDQIRLLAQRLNIPAPAGFEITDPGDYDGLPFPCVIKPRCGEKFGLTAAARYVIVSTPEEARLHFRRFQELTGEAPLVQTYLSGGGLGCSVLAENGTVLAAIAHRRIREYPVSGGPSSCCEAIDPAPYLPWVEKMVAETAYSGLAMFEFKEDSQGNPHILEVNPRIWGTFPLTRISACGIPLTWFIRSWNLGNPDACLPLPECHPLWGKKMIFCASDLMSALGYARKGKFSKTLSALGDLVNPGVRDGLLEWKDLRPAIAYFRSFLP